MRIVFCGTPDYAVPSLRKLTALAPRHEVVAVVSQPDRPKGRSREPSPPPVVAAARELGISAERIFQPKSINRPKILEALKALSPDVLCVVAYGNLLKAEALALPRLTCINAHGSILPRHRGASPIQAALLAGDAETGVTIIQMVLALDAGPMQLKRSIPIAPDDDAGTLHDKLAELSADCFVEAVEQLDSGTAQFTPQDETQTSYAAKLEKSSGQIEWSKDAAFVARFIRAMNPWPGAWTRIGSKDGEQSARIRVGSQGSGVRGQGSEQTGSAQAGDAEVVGAGEEAAIVVACGSGTLSIRTVQPEGKREMSVAEFLRGAGRKFLPHVRME